MGLPCGHEQSKFLKSKSMVHKKICKLPSFNLVSWSIFCLCFVDTYLQRIIAILGGTGTGLVSTGMGARSPVIHHETKPFVGSTLATLDVLQFQLRFHRKLTFSGAPVGIKVVEGASVTLK
jgi:hypothetical protein